jgi:hypothetical protein
MKDKLDGYGDDQLEAIGEANLSVDFDQQGAQTATPGSRVSSTTSARAWTRPAGRRARLLDLAAAELEVPSTALHAGGVS